MRFWEYELTAPTLCLGERIRGGLWRPCDAATLRYSTITGALRSLIGGELHAAGYLVQDGAHNRVQHLVYGPQDHAAGVSKLPLTVEYVADALGLVYVLDNGAALAEHLTLSMGALKSQGFGRCTLERRGLVDARTARGALRTRLPLRLLETFGVQRTDTVTYGYLFRPTSPTDGVYELALFEGSVVEGPDCLVEEDGDA
jgi:hypothetical protein